jgi:hypothetical protein
MGESRVLLLIPFWRASSALFTRGNTIRPESTQAILPHCGGLFDFTFHGFDLYSVYFFFLFPFPSSSSSTSTGPLFYFISLIPRVYIFSLGCALAVLMTFGSGSSSSSGGGGRPDIITALGQLPSCPFGRRHNIF